MPQPKEQPVQQRRAVGYWAVFNTCWREQHKELGRRPTRSEVSRWYAANADGVWGESKPTWLAFRDHAKCLRLTDDVKNYFKAYRNRKKSDSLAAKAPPAAKAEESPSNILPGLQSLHEISKPPTMAGPISTAAAAEAAPAKPEERLPSTPSSHPVRPDDTLWAFNSGTRMLQHLPSIGPVHNPYAGSIWPAITIETPQLASLNSVSSGRTLSQYAQGSQTLTPGMLRHASDQYSMIPLISGHGSLPRQLSNLSPKSFHDHSREPFFRPELGSGPISRKRSLSPDTPAAYGREKISRSIFGRQPWPATSPAAAARAIAPTCLAGNVITTGMAVFAWISDDSTSGESSDDSSKHSTSVNRNMGLTMLQEQHSVENGEEFQLEGQQAMSSNQLCEDPVVQPATFKPFLQEQCHSCALDRQISDTRQFYVVAE